MNKNVNAADSTTESALKFGRRTLAWSLIYLMVPLSVGDMFGQDAPPPPPPDQSQGGAPPQQAYNPLTPDQLNQLVAPIALYPDALVAQVLAASTFPNEIADADAFVQAHPGVPADQMGQMTNGMQWDPSIKALIAFPTVLDNLNKNVDWTNQLGNAYYNQPQDVMSAVQVMRQRAYEAGNLKSNQQLAVTYQPNNIVIAPANPTVVYVPYYNPWGVYGAPVVAWGGYYAPPPPPGYAFAAGLAIGFGVGIAVASWNHWGWGWNRWGCGWGSHSTVVYNRNVYVSRSVTVVNHGYYGGYDRNVAARSYNTNIARTAPNYRPGYNGTYPHSAAYHNSVNRTVTNNYNRTVVNNNNNINRTNTNSTSNRPGTTPGANNTYNRPGTNPGSTNNNNRPGTTTGTNNYNRPGTNPGSTNNNNRPGTTTGTYNYNRPGTNPTANNNYNRSGTTPGSKSNTNNGNRPSNANTYNRPATTQGTNSTYKPSGTNNGYHPPSNASRPAPQSRPEPQSHPSGGGGGKPSGGGGGKPSGGGGGKPSGGGGGKPNPHGK
jgi:uncharacterized membrane protein YgcG